MLKRTVIFLPLLVLACGGEGSNEPRSGVDSSSNISTISEAESSSLCEWAIATQGGAGTEQECGDGFVIEVGTVAECVAELANFNCEITVAQFENCSTALGDNPCDFGGAACQPLFGCTNS